MGNYSHTATTTATKAVTYNKARTSLVITNASGATVFVSENPTEITTKGTPIPAGESYGWNPENGDQPELEQWVQTSAGTSDLRIIEQYQNGTPLGAGK